MIININHKMFIKASRLKKASLIITTTKKINLIMKFMSTSSIFILSAAIIIRLSNQNRNYINIYEKVIYYTLQKKRNY